jgi:hypothetical protein
VIVDHMEGRPLSVFRLAQQIAPELTSETTAIREIRDLVNRGLFEIWRDGRIQRVRPTGKLFENYTRFLGQYLSAFNPQGFIYQPMRVSYFVLYSTDDLVYSGAQFTEQIIGWAPEEIIGQKVGFMSMPGYPLHEAIEWRKRLKSGELLIEVAAHRHKITGTQVITERHATMERDRHGKDLVRAEYRVLDPIESDAILASNENMKKVEGLQFDSKSRLQRDMAVTDKRTRSTRG